jgi:hypothetical protein
MSSVLIAGAGPTGAMLACGHSSRVPGPVYTNHEQSRQRARKARLTWSKTLWQTCWRAFAVSKTSRRSPG